MKISIEAAATHYFPKKRSIDELALKAQKPLEWAKATGIEEVHVAEEGLGTTDVGALVGKKALDRANIEPESVDQLAFISEGINDYLYMDTSKSIIKKMGGRTDGEIHASDFHRGSNGTIGLIKFVGNQLLSNPSITTSMISSVLLWEHHSDYRLLGETFMGDGAAALILKKDLGYNHILSIALSSMSKYNMVTGFKYGGSRYDFTSEVVQTGKFCFNILDEAHLQGVLEHVVSFSISVGEDALSKAEMTIDNIDYIGISGFHKKYTDLIVSEFKTKIEIINPLETINIINPLATKGYLGSLGVMEVISQFLNDDDIPRGSTMLVIANGIDINVEAMVIRK